MKAYTYTKIAARPSKAGRVVSLRHATPAWVACVYCGHTTLGRRVKKMGGDVSGLKVWYQPDYKADPCCVDMEIGGGGVEPSSRPCTCGSGRSWDECPGEGKSPSYCG